MTLSIEEVVNRKYVRRGQGVSVPVPLYQTKAELFRTLGHPVRIRVLELLGDGPLAVRELLADIEIDASNLSQQLAVLRRVAIVTVTRESDTLCYALAGPDVADLMRAARSFLSQILNGPADLLDELDDEPSTINQQPAASAA